MTFSELQKLVKEGEGERLEFKLKANHPDKIVKSIGAFANTKGGVLLVGVEDNRQIKGCKDALEEQYVLEAAIHRYLSPLPVYHLQTVVVQDDKEVVCIDVQMADTKPVYWKDPDQTLTEAPKGKVYIRVADQTIQASYAMRQVLKGKSKGVGKKLQYGEKEKKLMEYLSEHQSITIADYAVHAGITMKQACTTLVFMCVMGVLDILPGGESEDRFVQAQIPIV